MSGLDERKSELASPEDCDHDWDLRREFLHSPDLTNLLSDVIIVKVRCRKCGQLGQERWVYHSVEETDY